MLGYKAAVSCETEDNFNQEATEKTLKEKNMDRRYAQATQVIIQHWLSVSKPVKCLPCDSPRIMAILYARREKLAYKANNVEINTMAVAIWTSISPKCVKMERENFIFPEEKKASGFTLWVIINVLRYLLWQNY